MIETPKCYFVSDLHLFARRSKASDYQQQLDAIIERAEIVVLGGDLFDFKWSTVGSLDATIEQAIDWLQRLIDINPSCQFIYLLGNHDCQVDFVERLADFASCKERLRWHHSHWQCGDTVFIHGDVADKITTPEQLEQFRDHWGNEPITRKSQFRQTLYDLVLQLRLHKLVGHILHRPAAVAKRLLSYLDHFDINPGTGLRKVYFGHTHAPLDGFELLGVQFYNGGAPLNGIPFRIVEVDTTGFGEFSLDNESHDR